MEPKGKTTNSVDWHQMQAPSWSKGTIVNMIQVQFPSPKKHVVYLSEAHYSKKIGSVTMFCWSLVRLQSMMELKMRNRSEHMKKQNLKSLMEGWSADLSGVDRMETSGLLYWEL